MIRLVLSVSVLILLGGCASTTPAPVLDRSASPAARTQVQTTPTDRSSGYYTVKKGDTLYSIALENGQDYREIAHWNNLENPSLIKEGQQLRVTPPSGFVSAPGVASRPLSSTTVQTRPLDAAPSAIQPPSSAKGPKREPKAGKEPYSDEGYARLQRGEVTPQPVAAAPKPQAPSPDNKPAAAANNEPGFIWPANGRIVGTYVEGGNKGIDIAGKAGDPVNASAEGKVVYAGSGLRGYGQLVIIKHDNNLLTAYAHNQKILVKEGQAVSRGQRIAEMGNTDADSVKLHFEVRRQGKPVDPAAFLPKR